MELSCNKQQIGILLSLEFPISNFFCYCGIQGPDSLLQFMLNHHLCLSMHYYPTIIYVNPSIINKVIKDLLADGGMIA